VRFQGFPRGPITQCGCAHDEIPDSSIQMSERKTHDF
jgi:hypothetical protein